MKTIKHLLLLCALVALAACSEDVLTPQTDIVPAAEDSSVDLISMVVPDIEMDATTRTKLIDDGTTLKFAWEENDAIGVMPQTGYPLKFPISADNAGKNTAIFDGGDWALKANGKYAAFYPHNKLNYEGTLKSVPYCYTGQSVVNYTEYDYLASGLVQPQNGQVAFKMKRMSAIVKVKILLPVDSKVTRGTLVAKSAVFGVKGTMDLSGSEPVMNPEVYTKTVHTDLELNLGGAVSNEYEFCMVVPPMSKAEVLSFRIYSTEFNTFFEAPLNSGEAIQFEAGKAYALLGYADYVSLKNKNLIASAEDYNDITFVKNSDGSVSLNNSTNTGLIPKIKKIHVNGCYDSSVCDEIEYFTSLEELWCVNNLLSSLDVSRNKELSYLDCKSNLLSSLDLSQNTKLNTLYCGTNMLKVLDVSNLTDLYTLNCSYNQLTSLDVSKNNYLVFLDCSRCQLADLNIDKCFYLGQLLCNNNQLTSIDVSDAKSLYEFNCGNNKLTTLDLSGNVNLNVLTCFYNQLDVLDLSKNVSLTELKCNSNKLTNLIIPNSLKKLSCSSNLLTKLELKGKNYEEVDCGDNLFTTLTLREIPSLTIFRIDNCPKLHSLYVERNSLTTLNVSLCPALILLYCEQNKLTNLDLSSNTALEKLYCHTNDLTALDITKNTKLDLLYCHFNHMTSLDASKCPNLTWPKVRCGRQTNKTTGSYIYINVDGNDNMMEYFFENGDIPYNDSETEYNYYVNFG